MLRAGRTQKLTVSRVSEYGLYLTDEEQNEVLLPNRYISLADKPGDEKEVFVYHDSEDRLVATTETPLLRAGEAGYLRVVDKTAHGAFLDWGCTARIFSCPTATSRAASSRDGVTSYTSMKTASRGAAWRPPSSRASSTTTWSRWNRARR
ncbi:MAG: S1-like domain-containing RNA-binding protein [Alistipes finegoldii]